MNRSLAALAPILGWAVLACAQPAGATETITIGGTGTALGGMARLARAFEAHSPAVAIDVLPSIGSGGGIRALAAGKIQIAVSTRPLTEEEVTSGLEATAYAQTPFAFVAHAGNPDTDVTEEWLAAAYRGDLSSWSDGTPLRPVLRPEDDGDNMIVAGLSDSVAAALREARGNAGYIVAPTDQDSADVLERLPGAFGTITLAQLVSEGRNLKPLTWKGAAPSVEALAAGSYELFKTLFIVTAADPPGAVSSFVEFMGSEEGRAVLAASGSIPLDP